MKVLVIGGTGHIGSFLVPMLGGVAAEVSVVSSRGKGLEEAGWENVLMVKGKYARNDSNWREFIGKQEFDVLIDILGADVPNTYEAVKKHCKHYIVCGSLWMFGKPKVVPTPEITQGPCQFEGYAQRYSEMLATKKQAEKDGVMFTGIMPPNICGPGKIPLDGHGGRSLEVHKAHARGEAVKLAKNCNNLIGPCDAEDVAQGFFLAACQSKAAAGEIFNVGSAYSLTAPEFIEAYGKIYGSKIPIEFVSHDEFYSSVLPDVGANTHFSQHMMPDISKIRGKLGYKPKYSPEETMERAVGWMKKQKLL